MEISIVEDESLIKEFSGDGGRELTLGEQFAFLRGYRAARRVGEKLDHALRENKDGTFTIMASSGDGEWYANSVNYIDRMTAWSRMKEMHISK